MKKIDEATRDYLKALEYECYATIKTLENRISDIQELCDRIGSSAGRGCIGSSRESLGNIAARMDLIFERLETNDCYQQARLEFNE